jgi:hypothetical protein
VWLRQNFIEVSIGRFVVRLSDGGRKMKYSLLIDLRSMPRDKQERLIRRTIEILVQGLSLDWK